MARRKFSKALEKKTPTVYDQLCSKEIDASSILGPLGIDSSEGTFTVLSRLGEILASYGSFKDEGSRLKLTRQQVVVINLTAYLLMNIDNNKKERKAPPRAPERNKRKKVSNVSTQAKQQTLLSHAFKDISELVEAAAVLRSMASAKKEISIVNKPKYTGTWYRYVLERNILRILVSVHGTMNSMWEGGRFEGKHGIIISIVRDVLRPSSSTPQVFAVLKLLKKARVDTSDVDTSLKADKLRLIIPLDYLQPQLPERVGDKVVVFFTTGKPLDRLIGLKWTVCGDTGEGGNLLRVENESGQLYLPREYLVRCVPP